MMKWLAATSLAMAAPAYGLNVSWNVAGPSNNWDTVTANWTGDSTFYANGDNATFSNIAGETITLVGVIAPNSTTVSAASGTYTFTGTGITTGTVTKSGGGTLVMNNANSYAGLTAVNAGVLRIGNNTALGSTAGSTTVANGARLELAGGITVTGETINIIGQGGNNQGALQNQSGNNTWAGNVVINSADARVGAASGILTLSGVIDDGVNSFALNVRNADASGATVVSNVNTYGGATNIVVGPLRLAGGNNRLPTGTVLNIGNGSNVATATFDLNGFNQTVAGLASAGTIMGMSVTNGSLAPSTLTVNNSSEFIYGGSLASGVGVLNLTKTGAAALTLTGNNNALTGLVDVVGGQLRLGSDTAGSANATWNISAGQTILFNTDVGGAGAHTVSLGALTGAGTLRNGGNQVGTTTFSIGGKNTSTSFTGNIVDFDADTNTALTKVGTGTLTLGGAGANNYTGLTTINAGALRIAKTSGLGSTLAGTIVNGGGRLELSGGITVTGEALTISGDGGNFFGALQSQSGDNTWAGSVVIGANDTRIGSAGAGSILRISGVIDDGASSHNIIVRHENANGILELSGANTYGGATNIFIGGLRIAGADDRLPTSTSLNFGVPANGGGFSSNFNLNGFNQTVAGLTSVDTGTPDVITLTNSSATASTLTVNNAGANSFGGVASGNLAIVKGGVGTLTFTAANTYNGNTTINQGILALSGSGSIDNSPVISIGTGATFDVSAVTGTYNLASGQSLIGNGSIIGDVVTDAGSLISPGFSIGTLSFANNLDINGNILIEVDPAAAGQKIDIINIGGILDVAGANLVFDFLSSPVDGTYVFATYGSLVGDFATISGMPSGYEIKFNFNGQNQIALVSIPEPATMSLLALGSLGLLRRRRSV